MPRWPGGLGGAGGEGDVKVVNCHDVRQRAGALIDEELQAGDASAILAHAAGCSGCAAVVAEQRLTRALVGAHAAELRGVAPEALRTAVAATLATTASVRPFPARVTVPRRWTSVAARWSVAAALILAVGGVFALGGFGGSRLFAAQLALDHYKCLLLDHGRDGVSPEALEASWQADRGWSIDVPPSQPSLGVALVGVRRCLSGEGQMAHLLYEVRGQRVSLFIVPAPVDAAAADLPIMGVDTTSWTKGGRTYTLVGAAAPTSGPVADYMRAHVQ